MLPSRRNSPFSEPVSPSRHAYFEATELRRVGENRHKVALADQSFDQLISDLSERFADVPTDEVDTAIVDMLRQVVEVLGLDRSTLFQASNADDDLVVTHAWARPGLTTLPVRASAKGHFPRLLATVRAGRTAWFSSVNEVVDPVERETFRSFNIKSDVTIPLRTKGRVFGALGFTAMNEERRWSPETVRRLRLVARIAASAIAHEQRDSELRSAQIEVERLRGQLSGQSLRVERDMKTPPGSQRLAAESTAIRLALTQMEQVARTGATVLLTGETGSGKEVFAQAIHDLSQRHHRPMVRVNCGAIPSALIESELFGRERGAYTGALSRQAGRFELAEGSTIFLDEIGDVPFEAQVKLLRAIQEKEIERLGGMRSIKVDVRVIAATNRDLERGVDERTFREDLYYRLNVFPITVPPLRERVEDIPTLVWTFIDEFSKACGKPIESISKEDMAALQRYSWPGNVRELRNVIERAVIFATGPHLRVEPPQPTQIARRRSVKLTDVETEHIRSVLDSTRWRVRGTGGAADLLGLKPSTLESRMTKLGIRRA
jgi:formate hydrogenlyase transcriptional activator